MNIFNTQKKIIYIQMIGNVPSGILIKLKKDLDWVLKDFKLNIRILRGELSLLDAEYDFLRKQYNASLILERILRFATSKGYYRILGIINEDLWAGYLNFVFGVASNPVRGGTERHSAALLSVIRLNEGFYNRENDRSILEVRTLKESIHELGHTFGLEHCKSNCVMRFSNSLREVDLKPLHYCSSCRTKILDFNE
jgi:archaemetzincin